MYLLHIYLNICNIMKYMTILCILIDDGVGTEQQKAKGTIIIHKDNVLAVKCVRVCDIEISG